MDLYQGLIPEDKTTMGNLTHTQEFLGKLPPQAIKIEEAVLGAIMIDKNAIEEIVDIISPKVFYKEAHQHIYEAIQELYREKKAIDILTVTNRCKKNDILEDVGGGYYISVLTNNISSAAHIVDHAKILIEKYVSRELIRLSAETEKLAYEDETDIYALLNGTAQSCDNLANNIVQTDNILPLAEIVKESYNQLNERIKTAKTGKLIGVPTGLTSLNHATNGWQDGDLIVIASRPGMGKTALSLTLAKEAARTGRKVGMFNLEMSAVRLSDRILAGEADVNLEDYRSGRLKSEDLTKVNKAVDKLLELGIYIDDTACLTPEMLRHRIKYLHRQGKCDVVIVDYLQLEDMYIKNGSREQAVSEASRMAKVTAQELNIPYILLCQLNRGVESRTNKKPLLSDLRESGAIEQDADMVMFIYRPEYYGIKFDDMNIPTDGKTCLIIAKYREGATGELWVRHNKNLTRYCDIDSPVKSVAEVQFQGNDDLPF